MKQPPRLLRSELTDRVYIVTKYRADGRLIEASEKFDVTDEFVSVAFALSEDWWNKKADSK